MYGTNQPAHPIHSLPKQEVQRAWTTLKTRDLVLKQNAAYQINRLQQQLQFNRPNVNSQVKVTPVVH